MGNKYFSNVQKFFESDSKLVNLGLRSFMSRIYAITFLGLSLTFCVACLVTNKLELASPSAISAFFGSSAYLVAVFLPIGLIFVLHWLLRNPESSLLSIFLILLLFYSCFGVSMSVLGFVYNASEITHAILVTCGVFLAMSIFGYTYKRSLSGIATLCIILLFGMIIGGIVSIVFGLGGLSWFISLVGIFVFAILMAWKAQQAKIRYFELENMYGNNIPDNILIREILIFSISVFISFINFLRSYLYVIGGRR